MNNNVSVSKQPDLSHTPHLIDKIYCGVFITNIHNEFILDGKIMNIKQVKIDAYHSLLSLDVRGIDFLAELNSITFLTMN